MGKESKENHYDARNITDTLHVDNDRGIIKMMKHVPHKSPVDYFKMLKAKINTIIDGLIKHLHDSRDDLSTKEMKANEDYAKFMIALEKENKELAELIKGLEAENKALEAQLEKTKETLEEFKGLLKAAQENLRREAETDDCKGAMKIFNEVLGTDEELKALLNGTADLKKSVVIKNEKNFNTAIDNNEAKDIKVVF